MNLRICLLTLVCLMLPWAGPSAQEDPPDQKGPPARQDEGFIVVINAAGDATAMERSRVAKIFLKKVKSWDDGASISPVDQDPKSVVRESFTRAIHAKKVSAIEGYWQRRIFSGRDVPPPILDSDQEVIDYVRGTPGAIGYVANGTELGDGVTELELTD